MKKQQDYDESLLEQFQSKDISSKNSQNFDDEEMNENPADFDSGHSNQAYGQPQQQLDNNQNIENVKGNKKYKRIRLVITPVQRNRIFQFDQDLKLYPDKLFAKIFWQQYLKAKKQNNNRSQLQQWVRNNHTKIKSSCKKYAIEKQVVRSVNFFIHQYQNNIKIFVHHDTLKIQILTEQQIHCQSILHVYKLQDNILRYMSTYAKNEDELTHSEVEKKTAQLFISLFKCLQCLLQKEVSQIEKPLKKLISLDFLFSPKQESKNKPIYIGGLKYTCLNFFKNLIKMILQCQSQIMSKIVENLANIFSKWGLKIEKKDFQNSIKNKLQKLKVEEFYNNYSLCNGQMKHLFTKVMGNFYYQVQNVSSQRLFNSFESLKLKLIENLIYQFDNLDLIKMKITDAKISVRLSGKIVPKKRLNSINKVSRTKKCLDSNLLNLLKDFFSFENPSPIDDKNPNLFKDKIFICHNYSKDNILKQTLILFSSGEFHLFAFNPQKLQNFKEILEREYKGFKLIELIKKQSRRGKLNLSPQNALRLYSMSFDQLNLKSCTRFRNVVQNRIEKREDYMRNVNNKIHPNKPKYNSQKLYEENLKIIYTESCSSKLQKNYEQKMVFSINKQGDFKVTGVWDERILTEAIKKIERQVNQTSSKRKMFEDLQDYHQKKNITLIGGKSVNSGYLKTGKTDHNNDFKITKLSLDKDNNLIGNLQKQSISINKMKILIWNINSTWSCEDKSDQYITKWMRQRIQLIVEEIIKQNADFVFLQQMSIFFNQNHNFIYNNLRQKLQSSYYYSKQGKNESIYKKRRSIILSKIPVNFYLLDYYSTFRKQDIQGNLNELCQFKLNINGQLYSTLFVSIHLKCRGKTLLSDERSKQLTKLKTISDNFQITILAGDFNIGEDKKQYQQNDNEFFTYFKDLDDYFHSNEKPFTYYKGKNLVQRFDRILIRFKGQAQILKDLLLARPRQFGNFTSKPYQSQYYKQITKNKGHRVMNCLSDHFGRCNQIMFKTQSSVQMKTDPVEIEKRNHKMRVNE